MLAKEKEISALLLEAQKKEGELRHQKAHITWLQTPDLNTHFFFFHLSTIVRRRRNGIEALQNAQG